MRRTPTLLRKPGFSSIELIVSISIIAILAVLLGINYSRTQSQARDAARKADVATIGAAVNNYITATGTSFIRMPVAGASGQYDKCVLPADIKTPPDDPVPNMILPTGADAVGCTGASGRAYGKINAKRIQVKNAVDGQDRTYAANSIVEALVAGNFLNSYPKDPKNRVGALDTAEKASLPDYVLIRSCPIPSGSKKFLQYVGDKGGAVYSVWAQLENTPAPADVANRSKSAGSYTTDNAPAWSWDMAVFNLAEYNGLQANGFVYTNTLVQKAANDGNEQNLATAHCTPANT